MAMTPSEPQRPSFAPRNWPGWMVVGLIWLLGRLPQRLGIALSRPLGWLLMKLMRRRVKIAERNIERCFPEWSGEQRDEAVRGQFRSLARMLFEQAWSWSAPEKRVDSWGGAVDAEYANRLTREGRGVLLLTCHSTCIEIGGYYAGRATIRPWLVYRPLNSPVIDWYSNRCRRRYSEGGISKRVFRSMIALLRAGGVLWYAPDQDFGPSRSEFAPFFGIQTATLAAVVHLVEKSGCAVVPMLPSFDEKTGRYESKFLPPLENFPSGDLVADLARINAIIEAHVRQYPTQYWWIHRRFKTRPEGEPPFYD